MRRRRRYGRLAVGRLPHHGDAVGGVEDDAEPGADQFLIVDHEHPDRVRRGGDGHRDGSRAVTAKPSAPVGPTLRLPPQDTTRSAIPARPSPDPASSEPGWPITPSRAVGGPAGRRPESVTLTVMYPAS